MFWKNALIRLIQVLNSYSLWLYKKLYSCFITQYSVFFACSTFVFELNNLTKTTVAKRSSLFDTFNDWIVLNCSFIKTMGHPFTILLLYAQYSWLCHPSFVLHGSFVFRMSCLAVPWELNIFSLKCIHSCVFCPVNASIRSFHSHAFWMPGNDWLIE